jgi:hypothetical protein
MRRHFSLRLLFPPSVARSFAFLSSPPEPSGKRLPDYQMCATGAFKMKHHPQPNPTPTQQMIFRSRLSKAAATAAAHPQPSKRLRLRLLSPGHAFIFKKEALCRACHPLRAAPVPPVLHQRRLVHLLAACHVESRGPKVLHLAMAR